MTKEWTTKLFDGRIGVRAQVRVEVPEDGGRAVLRFVASTAAIDRYGEVIEPRGWDLAAYRKNPVFQNAHRYGDVLHTLGRATRIEVGPLGGAFAAPVLWMEVEFAVKENPVAAIAYRLYKGGFLNAVSVGFIPVHVRGIRGMLARHNLRPGDLRRFVAGTDVFSRESTGVSVAKQYARHGVHLRAAFTDRRSGWAEIMQGLGDPDRGIAPTLLIHERCKRLIETLGELVHDPGNPDDVLKVDADENGVGGDDAADALRYLVATKGRRPGFAVG